MSKYDIEVHHLNNMKYTDGTVETANTEKQTRTSTEKIQNNRPMIRA